MNKENMSKFIEALRSGEYPQVRGILHTDYGFCAEGVACDVSGQGQWGKCEDYYEFYSNREVTATGMTQTVRKWLGLGVYQDLALSEEAPWATVVSANDSGAPFDEIAAWLEKTYMQ